MIQLKVLQEMYETFSPSKFEDDMSKLVTRELDKLGISYYTYGNTVYNFLPDTPLLSAHLDQVGTVPTTKVIKSNGIITGNFNIGADDKNGCWIVLNLLKKFPHTSFIFSEMEECGGGISQLLKSYKDELTKIKYGLIFDRKGASDIVCWYNDYGTKEFEDDLCIHGEKFGFKSSRGVWSDADELSLYISCANLSCGYHNPHTNKEFTIIKELYNSYNFGVEILSNVDGHYEKADHTYWRRTTTMDHSVYSNAYVDYNHYDGHYDYSGHYKDEFYKVKYCKKCLKMRGAADIWSGECLQCGESVTKHFIYHCNICEIDYIDEEIDDMCVCPICGMQLQQFDDHIDVEDFEDNEIVLACPKCSEPLTEDDMFHEETTGNSYCYFCNEHVMTEDVKEPTKISLTKQYSKVNSLIATYGGKCPLCKNKISYKDIYTKGNSLFTSYHCGYCERAILSEPGYDEKDKIDSHAIVEIHDDKCPECDGTLSCGGLAVKFDDKITQYLCFRCGTVLGTRFRSIDHFIGYNDVKVKKA